MMIQPFTFIPHIRGCAKSLEIYLGRSVSTLWMRPVLLLILMWVWLSKPAPAYSVLAHEAIIDANWPLGIQPLLLKRFPATTNDQLRDAHAYAYGGAILQDMGYYPLGNKFFSDLVHYVRTGDFVQARLRDAQDVNEYAFALGALAHYASDNDGHPFAINRAVPMLYPKLEREYGSSSLTRTIRRSISKPNLASM